MSEKDEDTEKLVKKAGTSTRVIADGRPGLSIALEAVAELQVMNIEHTKKLNQYSETLVSYSDKLEKLTALLIYITAILFTFGAASLYFELIKEYSSGFALNIIFALIILALFPTFAAMLVIYKINPLSFLRSKHRK